MTFGSLRLGCLVLSDLKCLNIILTQCNTLSKDMNHLYLQNLHAANVGNTGFLIIRDGFIFRKSNAMFHEFSFPLHIVKDDDHSDIIEVCNLPCNFLSFSPAVRNIWKIIVYLFL